MNTTIEISKLVPWVGSIVVAVSIGVYTFTKYLNKQVVDAFQQRLNAKDEKLEDLKKQLEQYQTDIKNENIKDLVLPNATKENLPIELINKYEQKRNELNDIIVIIQNASSNIFEPNSEISNLAELLKQDDTNARKNGVKGLLELRDDNITSLLLSYFFLHEKEATIGILTIGEWIRHFDSISKDTCISFCLNLIKNGENFNAQCAYEWLLNNHCQHNYGYEDLKPYIQELKVMAINHNEPLRRTWAKKLIEIYEFLKDFPGLNLKQRGMYQIVLDIESYLKKALPLDEEENNVQPNV